MIIANIKNSLKKVVCIKTKQKHLPNNHYLIKNSDEEIRLLHSQVIKTRLFERKSNEYSSF
ncbi:IS30 family transposase [Mycoplasma anatis]|uniref:hypothetical protein n=1 Tax=Mycoplasmopsis anatis TaxID=171279 RepID=UPI001C4DFF41|nr:hypothetical protein [Mycoplasmopsis anatis]MBW0594708.1 IS30 family transposase [Mycoplasmopsis anatis]MBW0598286.1 IS30 family transposase [Mycoplasmopsis anatis]MBW0599032.1 IS30 family transposase [Mycoplasmopsis anatis]